MTSALSSCARPALFMAANGSGWYVSAFGSGAPGGSALWGPGAVAAGVSGTSMVPLALSWLLWAMASLNSATPDFTSSLLGALATGGIVSFGCAFCTA